MPAKEEKKAEEAKAVRKGPRPRGMAKFKPLPMEEAPIPEDELSENQLKKRAKAEAKRLAEVQQKKEDERLRKEAEEKERIRIANEIFEGMAAAN